MTIIEAQSVSKRFYLRHNASSELKVRFLNLLHRQRREVIEEFWALKNLSLRIDGGEAVGLVGRNGSGKSTLLKLVAAIHRPTSGRLLVARGARIASMIELGVGFHPELTGRENVFLNAAIHGMNRQEIEAIYGSIVSYSGLEHFIDVPLKTYSSGMYMRLGFAIAANLAPDILLLDEIFAVGDADFQQRCEATVKGFLDEGKTLLFVSHAPTAIRSICRRVCVLEGGHLTFDGGVEQGLAYYERSLSPREAGQAAGSDSTDGREAGGTAAGRADAADGSGDTDVLHTDVLHTDEEPHRAAVGGKWDERGEWQFDFLRRQGLERHHFVLDVACGSLAGAVRIVPFLEPGHYFGFERNLALIAAGVAIELPRAGIGPERAYFTPNTTFDLGYLEPKFDFALADSLFSALPFNDIARCIATVVRALGPGGRFYATWFENPDASSFAPIERGPGITTYPDREPYHYPFQLIEGVCDAVGATVERVGDSSHPLGESILLIRRKA